MSIVPFNVSLVRTHFLWSASFSGSNTPLAEIVKVVSGLILKSEVIVVIIGAPLRFIIIEIVACAVAPDGSVTVHLNWYVPIFVRFTVIDGVVILVIEFTVPEITVQLYDKVSSSVAVILSILVIFTACVAFKVIVSFGVWDVITGLLFVTMNDTSFVTILKESNGSCCKVNLALWTPTIVDGMIFSIFTISNDDKISSYSVDVIVESG